MMNHLMRRVFHPFLWSVYPILMLVAYNIQQMDPSLAYRSILISLCVAAISFFVLRLIIRDWQKAGLIVTLAILLFYSYGHVYGLVNSIRLLGINLGRHSLLLPLWVALLAVGVVMILRARRDLSGMTQAFNVIAMIALVFPVYQVIAYELRPTRVASMGQNAPAAQVSLAPELASLKPPSSQNLPDIYYIILDAYARDDMLDKYFNLDNGPFLQKLEGLGFYVARCSQSNYSRTQLSLASSLNLNYLDTLGISTQNANDQDALNQLILNNQARQALQEMGYQTVVIDSGFSPTSWLNADIYLSADKDTDEGDFFGGVNPFEALLLRTTGGLMVYRAYPFLPKPARMLLDTAYTQRRNRILYALDELPEIPDLPGPKFVFVHILAPHEPFVFGAKGEVVVRKTPFTLNGDLEYSDPQSYANGYRNQVKYMNSRVAPLLESILSRSKTPPVIVIQGDHGSLARASSPGARMAILNAYYLPGTGSQQLYASISPVNTFRLIFNEFLGGQLNLLPDQSYYYDKKGGEFTALSDERPGCAAQTNR